MAQSAVDLAAQARGIPVAKPATLKSQESHDLIAGTRADVMVVAAYGLLLPASILATPGYGCINIHASKLPRWRGAAPVHRAILSGDRSTGISIMRMDEGLDTGPVLLSRDLEIAPRETTGSLLERLAALGARSIIEALAALDRLVPEPQDEALATYAPKVSKAEARIDWTRSAAEIDRQVRAFDPAPGAEARAGEAPLKIWKAEPVAANGNPGDVLGASAESFVVACGQDALRLIEVQRAGRARMSVGDFLRGSPWPAGARMA